MRNFLLSLALMLSIIFSMAGCEREDTPEAALEDIKQAIEQCNDEKFSERADVRRLLDVAYDDASLELASRVREFGAAYPDDPFFKNTAEDIILYNELNRDEHMKFINAVVDECFDRTLTPPANFNDDTIKGTAAELRHYFATAQSTVKDVKINGLRAEIRIEATVESLYAGGSHVLPLVLEFEKAEERWRLKEIKNVGEIITPLVDIAEILWPDQFNS